VPHLLTTLLAKVMVLVGVIVVVRVMVLLNVLLAFVIVSVYVVVSAEVRGAEALIAGLEATAFAIAAGRVGVRFEGGGMGEIWMAWVMRLEVVRVLPEVV